MSRINKRVQQVLKEKQHIHHQSLKFDESILMEDVLRLADPAIYNSNYKDDIKTIFHTLLNFRCYYAASKKKWVLVQHFDDGIKVKLLEDQEVFDFVEFLFEELIPDRFTRRIFEKIKPSFRKN